MPFSLHFTVYGCNFISHYKLAQDHLLFWLVCIIKTLWLITINILLYSTLKINNSNSMRIFKQTFFIFTYYVGLHGKVKMFSTFRFTANLIIISEWIIYHKVNFSKFFSYEHWTIAKLKSCIKHLYNFSFSLLIASIAVQ